MKTIPLEIAERHFTAIVAEIIRTLEEVVITVDDLPAVVIVDVAVLKALKETLKLLSDPEACQKLKEAQEQMDDGD